MSLLGSTTNAKFNTKYSVVVSYTFEILSRTGTHKIKHKILLKTIICITQFV